MRRRIKEEIMIAYLLGKVPAWFVRVVFVVFWLKGA